MVVREDDPQRFPGFHWVELSRIEVRVLCAVVPMERHAATPFVPRARCLRIADYLRHTAATADVPDITKPVGRPSMPTRRITQRQHRCCSPISVRRFIGLCRSSLAGWEISCTPPCARPPPRREGQGPPPGRERQTDRHPPGLSAARRRRRQNRSRGARPRRIGSLPVSGSQLRRHVGGPRLHRNPQHGDDARCGRLHEQRLDARHAADGRSAAHCSRRRLGHRHGALQRTERRQQLLAGGPRLRRLPADPRARTGRLLRGLELVSLQLSCRNVAHGRLQPDLPRVRVRDRKPGSSAGRTDRRSAARRRTAPRRSRSPRGPRQHLASDDHGRSHRRPDGRRHRGLVERRPDELLLPVAGL